jgi:cardiolipin synthase (CMP-forming)
MQENKKVTYSKNKVLSIPNILTFLRIIIIPTIVVCFYIDSMAARWAMFSLYTIAGISDFLDGYLARKLGQFSDLGKLLDPIADKVLVATTLILMVAVDKLKGFTLIPTLIILSREFLVSGLREFLANFNVGMPVTELAKWKTFCQMFAIGTLLFSYGTPSCPFLPKLGAVLLWIAAILTLITGYIYLKQTLIHVLRDRKTKRKK